MGDGFDSHLIALAAVSLEMSVKYNHRLKIFIPYIDWVNNYERAQGGLMPKLWNSLN